MLGAGGARHSPIPPCGPVQARGLTLHLSSCDNITSRDAGHVDQVDRTMSLNIREEWEMGSSIPCMQQAPG